MLQNNDTMLRFGGKEESMANQGKTITYFLLNFAPKCSLYPGEGVGRLRVEQKGYFETEMITQRKAFIFVSHFCANFSH